MKIKDTVQYIETSPIVFQGIKGCISRLAWDLPHNRAWMLLKKASDKHFVLTAPPYYVEQADLDQLVGVFKRSAKQINPKVSFRSGRGAFTAQTI